MAVARSLAAKLPADQAKGVEERLQNLNVRVIAIGTVNERMIYDKEIIVVQAGKPVEFPFFFRIPITCRTTLPSFKPGSLEEVGNLAEETGRDKDAKDRHYIPKSNKIMLASKLLEPKQTQALTLKFPPLLVCIPIFAPIQATGDACLCAICRGKSAGVSSESGKVFGGPSVGV